MQPDYAAAEHCIAQVAAHGIDIDGLGELLQRQGARAFEADWATLLEAISTKITQLSAEAPTDQPATVTEPTP
jgi:transaldolase